MTQSSIFSDDDYAEIRARYFNDLDPGRIDADPSGWISTYSAAEVYIELPRLASCQLSRYYIDEGNTLGAYKEHLCQLLSAWENYAIDGDEFTLCPSGASASLTVIAALKKLGVKRILFETPAYFGTIEQAEELGMPFELIPTYRGSEYKLPDLSNRLKECSDIALWLTQPRASLGFNQSTTTLTGLLSDLSANSYLVVDEATDQSFPASLSKLSRSCESEKLIRIRSFAKGMGLNGLRLAAVLHSKSLRGKICGCLESLGGSIDIHSLAAVAQLSQDVPRLKLMLEVSNKQVNELRSLAQRLTQGTPLVVNNLVNGYIGTITADLKALGSSFSECRGNFLQGCADRRTPVILGASCYMAKDPPFEAVRLNFFSQPDQIIKGIHNMLDIWPIEARIIG